MANIYDVAAAIKQPDIMGNFQAGQQAAQQNQVFGEKQQAYQQALSDQQNIRALAPQVIAGDPSATEQAQAIDPQAAAQYAGAAQQHLSRLSGAIKYIDQQQTPQGKEAAYQQVRPYLAQFGQQPPATFAEAEPKMEQARAQIAALSGQQKPGYINVSAGGALVDPMTGKTVYTKPGVENTPAIVSVNMLDGSMQQYQHNADGKLSPLRLAPSQGSTGSAASAPQGQFQTTITPASPPNMGAAAQANALLAQGMQPQQVMQRLIQANPDQKFQLAVDPQTGQFKDVSDGSAQFSGAAPSSPDQLGRSAPKGSDQKAPTGYQYNADHTALVPIPGGPADKGQAASPLGDPTQTGASYLQSIGDPAMEAMVKAVAEGRMPLPKIYRSGKAGEIGPTQIAQAVAQYDPTYDQADPTSRIKARNDFTSGKSAVQLRQLNTLLGHIGGLSDAADKLDNTGNTLINSAENAIGSTYNTKVSNFEAAARPAAEEFAALLKGGVPSVEEIKAAHAMLDANKTPAQLNGVIGTMAAQIQSRIAALHAQAQNSLGPFANKVTIITPEGQAALDKLREKGLIGKFDLGEAPQNEAQAAPASVPSPSAGWSIQRVQ